MRSEFGDIGGLGGYTLTLESGKIAEISGCARVISYSCDKIILGVGGGRLTIVGKNMTLTSFFPKEVTISGKISSVTSEVVG